MADMEWWSYLPETVYRDWKANQFTERWQEKLNQLAAEERSLAPNDAEEPPPADGVSGQIRSRLGSVLSGQPMPPDPNSPLFAPEHQPQHRQPRLNSNRNSSQGSHR